MRSRVTLLFVLLLFVLTPLSQAINSTAPTVHLESPQQSDVMDVPSLSDEEQLELAAEHWGEMPQASMIQVDLKDASGILHLAAGSFDPTLTNGPDVAPSLHRSNDAAYTGLAIVQLHNPNGHVLSDLVTEYDLRVLDTLHDEGWLVRLPVSPTSMVQSLNEDSRVRWAGHQEPGWRLAPELLTFSGEQQYVSMIPSDDLGLGGYGDLATDLVRYGALEAWCDSWSCQSLITSQSHVEFIRNIAHDGRIIWSEPAMELRVHNAVAWSLSGVQGVQDNAAFTLDGSGEMIAIADTGLDQNHPDLTGRVAATYTQFGLDSSPADSNAGHGTHIAVTVLGDGSGDTSARGIAPSANLVMYSLEHDPTGVFGRVGSIYDLLRDAEQMTARIAVNAWGLNGNYGQYTADARSVDVFVNDRQDLTPLFSVGDRGAFGASQVTSPGTAKNVIAIGASTTGSSGSALAGAVANFSSQGPSLDGRIKPDLVAPGVGICSGLAEEAQNPAGPDCLSGAHAGGNAYYMSLSGTSQATAVASGVAALTREFIREQAGVSSPSSALVKAAMINGATDLGTPDIPNNLEGWGQVDLERTVMPMDGTTSLDTFFDDNKPLESGFGLLYSFSLDPSHGIDITLAWTDEAGSANAPNNQKRLVNDLDLILIDPSGTEWLGNQFSQGFSVTGGSADDTNNVERIRIAPGTLTSSQGQWIVQVLHRGGTTQNFGLVMAAVATPTPQADLAVFDGSILTSSFNPLKNDLISIRLAWVNQGTSISGDFDIILEDTTTQQTLATSTRSALEPGMIDSYTIFHQFTSTGIHSLRLAIDTGNQVPEMNDATSGTDNNIWEQDVEVTALGVRVVIANSDGTVPETAEERSNNAVVNLDVRNDSGIDLPLVVLHEGTGNQSVLLSSTTVQIPAPGRDDFFLPSDDLWSRNFDETPNFILTAQGTDDANKTINLRLEDLDADLTSNPENPRFVRAGTYVVELTARYEFQPTVSHTQRVTIIVEQIDQVQVVTAGSNGLSAQPGGSSFFSISVRNTGNAPAQYSIECTSEQRWQLMLGGSNSSQLDFEPLNILEFLPMSIRIIVPLVANGVPAAGDTDQVTCYVTSFTDPTMNFTETVSIEVLPQESFNVDLLDDDGPLGPSQLADDLSVDSGQQVHLNVSVENTGNIAVELEVSVLPDNPQWAMEVRYDTQKDSRKVMISLNPGMTTTVELVLAVPITAEEGDSNTYTIRTERSNQNFIQNITTLIVRDELGINLTPPSESIIEVSIGDVYSYGEFVVKNTGNTDLALNWTHGLALDGWQVGFANPTLYLEPREEKLVRFGLIPPAQEQESENAFEILIAVTGSNAGRLVESSQMITIAVVESSYANITVQTESEQPLRGISRQDGRSLTFVVRNDGNIPLNAALTGVALDKDDMIRDDWSVDLNTASITDLAVGESVDVVVTLMPSESVSRTTAQLHLNITVGETLVASQILDVSVETATGDGGLFSILPPAVSGGLIAVILIGLIVIGRRMKKSGEVGDDGLELVAPNTHVSPDLLNERRNSALDLGDAVDDLTSGEVSDDEIAQAIMQSMDLPALPNQVPAGLPPAGMPPRGGTSAPLPMGLPPAGMPPVAKPLPALPQPLPSQPIVQAGPPLPPGGLPSGWTAEQWQHYGHEWLKRQG